MRQVRLGACRHFHMGSKIDMQVNWNQWPEEQPAHTQCMCLCVVVGILLYYPFTVLVWCT